MRSAVSWLCALSTSDQRAFAAKPALLCDIDVARIVLEDGLRRRDARADRGDRQHLVDDLAGQSEVGGVGATTLRLALRGGLLDLTPDSAEQIEIVADPAADRIQLEIGIPGKAERAAVHQAEAGEVDLFLLGACIGVDLRQFAAGDRAHVLSGGEERGVAGRKAVIVRHRAIDERIELRRSERLPPEAGGAGAGIGLWLAGDRRLLLGGRQIGGRRRHGRALEIGADRTAGERRCGEEEGEQAHRVDQSIWMWTSSPPAARLGLRSRSSIGIAASVTTNRNQKAST